MFSHVEVPSSGSECDGYGPSTSLESCADRKFYIHSGMYAGSI
jgi:hypothetical protein